MTVFFHCRSMPTPPEQVKLYGIRHHGPGSARALCEALVAEPPDLLLVEGPPEVEPLLGTFADSRVELPVALVHYVTDTPDRSVHSPYAVFSPEWQAINFALQRRIPIRMIDLPLRHQLAMGEVEGEDQPAVIRRDPLAGLAAAAGFEDPELWWEHLVEQRPPDITIFAALRETMRLLRAGTGGPLSPLEERREAWMRREIRLAAGGGTRIAVVCGAWHLPVLDPTDPGLPDELSDERLLSALPSVDVRSFWVPWSDRRLARSSGYEAGLSAPGWALHLWESEGRDRTTEWLTRSAALLRAHGHEVPSAAVIETARLATSLAAIRGLTRPGLAELSESTVATLCGGDDERFELIRHHLLIGGRVGRVPADAATPPLLEDWQRQCRALRLEPQASANVINLDLRQPLDLRRSRFLHQLDLLEIGWGRRMEAARTASFRESWSLDWSPRVALELNQAGMNGPTVETAVIGLVTRRLARLPEMGMRPVEITELIDLFGRTLLAGIGGARVEGSAGRVDRLIAAQLDRLTVDQADLRTLMMAFPSLVYLERYGNVHQFDPTTVATIVDRLVNRISIGITSLSWTTSREDSGEPLSLLEEVDRAMSIVGRTDRATIWPASLRRLFRKRDTPGSVAGVAGLLLWQAGELTSEELARAIERAFSPSVPAAEAAAWIEGLVRPSSPIIAHDHQLLRLIDGWLVSLDERRFIGVLPLLRRTFARLPITDRHRLGVSIAGADRAESADLEPTAIATCGLGIDPDRAELPIPILTRLLGLALTGKGRTDR